MKRTIFITALALVLLLAVGWAAGTWAQQSLKPPLPDLTGIVKDKNWALVLGKALFWDQQVGSDGQSCASCHFHAGADTRIKNQLTPGFLDVTYGTDGDSHFGSIRSDTLEVALGYMPSGFKADSNYTLVPEDFPMHELADHTNRNALIRTTTNDRVSSQGSFDSTFGRVERLRIRDWCSRADGSIFHAGKYAARQVEPRNTPTTINAAFNNRNFWDGRANNTFNGVGVFGMRDIKADPKNRLLVVNASGKLEKTYLTLENASLASQAVGPPLSEKEMSCDGRDFRDVGRKMLLRIPLALQKVHAKDSVLGTPGPFGDLRAATGRGLKLQYLYSELIKKAFEDKYWKATGRWEITDTGVRSAPILGYTQMEHNFSMFWGIAIMLYEASLVSDNSEFDQLVTAGKIVLAPPPAGASANTGDTLLDRGIKIFFRFPFGPPPADGVRGAGCLACHGAPTFSENAAVAGAPFNPFLGPVADINNAIDLRDLGFANIGLRPVFSDTFSGGKDPYGNPLSYGMQYMRYLETGDINYILDPYLLNRLGTAPARSASPQGEPGAGPGAPGKWGKLEVFGATKIPTVRNVALTPPYFSWGGYATLRQVMEVYNRGMSRRDIVATNGYKDRNPGTACTSGDDSGTGLYGDNDYPMTGVTACNTNVTGLIVPLGLSDCNAPAGTVPGDACTTKGHDVDNDDLAALVRLMKSLTDLRVQCDQAPFDHPSLFVIHGHKTTDANKDGRADDVIFELPEIGNTGYAKSSGFCIPNAGDLFAPGMQSRSGGLRVPLP